MSSRPIIRYDLDEMSKLSLEKIPCELHKKREPNAIKNIGSNINQLHETKIRTISSATPLYEINQIDKMAKTAAISTSILPLESRKKESNGKSGANFTSNAQGGEPKAKSMELTSKSYMHYPPNGHKLMEPVLKISSTDHHNQRTGSNSEAMAVTIVTTASTAAINTKMGEAKISDFINLYGQAGSNASSVDSLDGSNAPLKPHTGGDGRWDAIQLVNARDPPIGLTHFRLLKRLGYGDIGSVYLVELRGTETFFAMKVMDKASLAGRNKLLRAQTEREILGLLDHPFLPTLYSHFETEKFYCLVMEFCSGGNLHSLRQKQPNKHFTEQAARFYASEVLLALEYLHMLGIVYRDLKPENVLVREEGHIMLSDFDLSLRCNVNPTLVKSSSVHVSSGGNAILENEYMVHGCIQPPAFFSRILPKKARKSKSDFGLLAGGTLPELMAEPTNARSMSFVGTHEYLAPEIIRGEGHGSAVDWWTFGIFLYELLHGTTPFKGSGNHATLFNVVGQPLKFPEIPGVSLMARDLIRGLLVKDPQKRIAYRRGATEIKQHPFFEGVNWALIRSTTPPHVPDPIDYGQFASKDAASVEKKVGASKAGGSKSNSHDSSSGHLDFEYF